MTRLYLVRHGAHDLVGKVLVGRSPGVSLSQAGGAQAMVLAGYFSALPSVAEVLSSPLERCRETAAPIAAGLGVSVIASAALNELDYGEWTGSSFENLENDPRWNVWNSERTTALVPGGELLKAVQTRVMSLVENCAAGVPTVMVTHSDVIKIVILSLLGAPLDVHDRLEIEPASITTVDLWPGGGKVVRSNQVVV